MRTSVNDPMYLMLEEEKQDLIERQSALEAKKEKLGMMDDPAEIEQLHSLLGNFEAVWPTFDFTQRQRVFSLLINRIEVEVVSPHWLRLTIDWLDAVCPRLDVAYIWKATPQKSGAFSEEEIAIMRQYYPRAPYMDILQMLPDRTWASIQTQRRSLGLKREVWSPDGICTNACYRAIMPNGEYLFGDFETTMGVIQTAINNTAKSVAPLYASWLLSDQVEDLVEIVDRHLDGVARPGHSLSHIAPPGNGLAYSCLVCLVLFTGR
jgi:hypothetical protein